MSGALLTKLLLIAALISGQPCKSLEWPRTIHPEQLGPINDMLKDEAIDLANPVDAVARVVELIDSRVPIRHFVASTQTISLFQALLQVDECDRYTLGQIDVFTRIVNRYKSLEMVQTLLRNSGRSAMLKCYQSILEEKFRQASSDASDQRFLGIYQLDSEQIESHSETVYGSKQVPDHELPHLVSSMLPNGHEERSAYITDWEKFKELIDSVKNQCKAHDSDGFGYLIKFSDSMQFYFANELNGSQGPQYLDDKLKADTPARTRLCHTIIWYGKADPSVWESLLATIRASSAAADVQPPGEPADRSTCASDPPREQ